MAPIIPEYFEPLGSPKAKRKPLVIDPESRAEKTLGAFLAVKSLPDTFEQLDKVFDLLAEKDFPSLDSLNAKELHVEYQRNKSVIQKLLNLFERKLHEQ